MRHIPTALYIDAEFFYRQGLRFDTKAFLDFKKTFVKKGFRLLIPKMMEYELDRHFRRKAEETISAVIKAHAAYPIGNLSLGSLPSENSLKNNALKEMQKQWMAFRDYFVVENLPIVGNLEDVVGWYFDVKPPFFAGKKAKEFPDAFIISALDEYHRKHFVNIAIISKDDDFVKTCLSRSYFQSFSDIKDYIDKFIQSEHPEQEPPLEKIDLTKSIATEDLTVLRGILAYGNNVTLMEVGRVIKLLASKGTNYDYFFQNAKDKVWLQPLSEAGYFLDPPDWEPSTKKPMAIPVWLPINYLVRVFDVAPKEVLAEISKIHDTNNFWVLEGILRIILKANSADVFAKLYRFVDGFIENALYGQDIIINLLKKPFIFDSQLSGITPALLLKIVAFRPDPSEQEKRILRKEGGIGTLLEPIPRFNKWEYQQILEKGIRPLSEKEPYQVARILIDAVASMISMTMHQDDSSKETDEDSSEFWLKRLDAPSDYPDAKVTLVNTLFYACQQVYTKVSESVKALDLALRNQPWKIFRRLRQQLYAFYPNNITLPWIRELILEYEAYSSLTYHYEFQLMVRKASEYFGQQLLAKEEQSTIFDAILNGPSQASFRERMGEQYTEDAFRQYQRAFHLRQLRPFLTLLSEDYLSYFKELKTEVQEELTDDSYMPYKTQTGVVSYRSPQSTEELGDMIDDVLLGYLNDWDEEHHDKDNWFVEVNISALADNFQSLFRERIVSDIKRLDFWMQHRDDMERPIYITAMLKAMQELVKDKCFDNLNKWIEFCQWVLSHQDSENTENQPEPTEQSRDYPSWRSSRRAVVDFVDVCVDKDSQVPFSARFGLADILKLVCNQFDWRLDCDKPVFLRRDDPILEAINNTRSRALQSLINFGFWIQSYQPDDPVQEVTDILSMRLNKQAEIPLTRPEYALLGMHFSSLYTLNQDWAIKQRKVLFPKSNIPVWQEAFCSYIRYNKPFKETFEVLREDFEYAIRDLNAIDSIKSSNEMLISRLVEHLFIYYLRDVYPLKGKESLLYRFYEQTRESRQYWASFFNLAGFLLRRSGKQVDHVLVDRAKSYADWRLEVAEPLELQHFSSSWLEAECLEPKWRLRYFSRVLDLGIKVDFVYGKVKTLYKWLADYPSLIVECFIKIIDTWDYKTSLPIDEAKEILKAGMSAESSEIREKVKIAKENLLRGGIFDFLDVE